MGRRRDGHRLLLAGAGVAAVFLAVASTAYACTVFWGAMTVTGNGAGSVTQTIHGDPGADAKTFMHWCDYTEPKTEGEREAFWTVRTDKNDPKVTISVAPSTSCTYSHSGGNKLPAGTYTVTHKEGYMAEGGGTFATHNCHGSVGEILDGTFKVDANGNGSGAYSLTGARPGWSSVCVWLPDPLRLGHAPANALNFKNV